MPHVSDRRLMLALIVRDGHGRVTVSAELKVSLGVRADGSVVHITEIDPDTQRGLACGCVCADCGDQLVARVGRVRQRHFAHHSAHECVAADESALHLFAKELFTRHHRLKVPEARVWLDAETMQKVRRRPLTEHHSHEFLRDEVSQHVADACYVEYDEAVLEQTADNRRRPDITLTRSDDGTPLLVEVRVTHAVDEEKEAALKALGTPCLEIDLSAHHVGLDAFDRDGIEQLLIDGVAEKDWICIPDEATHFAALKERVEEEEAYYRRAEERERRKEREKREWLERTEDERRAKQDALLAPERMALTEKLKDTALSGHSLWKRNCSLLGVDPANVPYYLNEKVKGEYLFAVHRTVWQSTLFVSWVWGKDDPTRSRFVSVEYAVKNLHDTHPDFWEQSLYWAHKDRGDVLQPAAAVGDYFLALRDYGFLEEAGGNPAKPYTWKFQCVRPRVVTLPPEYNGTRYLPRAEGAFDTQTGQLIKLPIHPEQAPDSAPNR